MPEGFSSVADLKVIVDANTEKFSSGMQTVNGLLSNLQTSSNSSLGGVDQLLNFVGDTTLKVSGKVRIAMAAVEAGVAIYRQFAEEGRGAAEKLGVTTEYDKLTSSIEDLGLNLKDGAISAFFALTAAGSETAYEMLGFASSTDKASDSSKDFAAVLLTNVTQALDQARLAIRLYNSEQATSANSINTTISLAEQRMSVLRDNLRKMQTGALPREQGPSYSNGFTRTDLEKEALTEIAELEAKINALRGQRATLPGQDWVDATVVSKTLLQDEIEALQKRNETLGLSAGAAAEYNAVQKAVLEAQRNGIALTAEQLALIKSEAAEVGRLTQAQEDFNKAARDRQQREQRAEQQSRTEGSIFSNAERELLTLNQRTRALTTSSAATAELNTQERLLQQLRAAGITVDDAQLVRIKAISAAYRQSYEDFEAQQEKIRDFDAVGQAVSSNLSNAFSSWTNGAKLDVKNMVASILADLAQLTFQRNVIDTLFGGRGGGDSGGLLGGALSSIFGGFREGGGPVQAGKAYVVGEKRPELFIPDQNGSISPSVGAGGGGVQIVTNVDARGASVDAVAELKQMLAERDARLPSQVLGLVQESRQRNLS